MLQSIDFEAIEGNADPRLAQLFKFLYDSNQIDQILGELNSKRNSLPKLYLSERTLANFDAFQSILLHAVAVVKMGSLQLDLGKFLKSDELRTKIVGTDTWTEPMFEEHGFSIAFFMHERYYQQTLNALREEIHGETQDRLDVGRITNLAVSARTAHAEVLAKATEFGIAAILKD